MALQSTTALATVTLQAARSATQNDTFRQYRLQLNGDTSASYFDVRMSGNGSSTGSDSSSNAVELLVFSTGTGTNFATITTQIMDYSATNKHKPLLHRASAHDSVAAVASRWANLSAITSIRVFTPVGEFQAGSTFSLYGRIA